MSNDNIPTITSEPWPKTETSKAGKDQLRLYQIEVRNQGSLVAEHYIVAGSALDAITLIECEYGEPVQAEPGMIENDDGRRHQVMIAKNWHGYTFEARAVGNNYCSRLNVGWPPELATEAGTDNRPIG